MKNDFKKLDDLYSVVEENDAQTKQSETLLDNKYVIAFVNSRFAQTVIMIVLALGCWEIINGLFGYR